MRYKFARNGIVQRRGAVAISLAVAATVAAGRALAQEGEPATQEVGAPTQPIISTLDEIVVTAQRRSENLQEVPIAVAAVTAQQLKSTGIATTQDIPQIVPSVQFTRSGGSGLIFIRGVGTTTATIGEESSNSVYVDGVYLADLAQTINSFNNIQRIEVLKGPQGTLFGRNATGGLVHIITYDPADETLVNAEVSYANYDTLSTRLYLAAPVSERVSADIAITALNQGDGWGRNLNTGRENNVQEYWGARSKFVYRPSDELKIKLAADYYENQDNLGLGYKIDPDTLGTGGFTGPPGHDTTLSDYPLTTQTVWGLSLTGEWDLGFADLTSVTAFRSSETGSLVDVDGGPLPLLTIDYVWITESFQQELRLASSNNGPFSWQLGVFYLNTAAANDSLVSGVALAPAGLLGQHSVADLDTHSYAGFAEAAYAFTSRTELIGGLRYTKDIRALSGGQANINLAGVEGPFATNAITDLEYDAWTYRAALRHAFTDDINGYVSFNRGFKSGSYNLSSPLAPPYLPQYIDAFEVGLKSELFDRRLRLNVSAYHYDIEDYQVRSAAISNIGAARTFNAATVKVDGLDIEFELAPTGGLRLFGGATYLDSRFDKFGGVGEEVQSPIIYPNANSSANPAERTRCPANLIGTRDPGVVGIGPQTGGYTTCFGDVSGLSTQNAPDLTASLGITYRRPIGSVGEVQTALLYSYNSGFFFETDNIVEQDSFSLINASIEYRPTQNLGISLWGRNLADTEYAVQKISTGTGTTLMSGSPRTYGMTIKYEY